MESIYKTLNISLAFILALVYSESRICTFTIYTVEKFHGTWQRAEDDSTFPWKKTTLMFTRYHV